MHMPLNLHIHIWLQIGPKHAGLFEILHNDGAKNMTGMWCQQLNLVPVSSTEKYTM